MLVRFLLAAVLTAGLGSAQTGDDVSGGGMSGGRGGGGRGGGGGDMGASMGGAMPRAKTKVEQFFDKLKLNKEQQEEAQTILVAASNQAIPIRDQIVKGRQVIATFMLQKKTDEEMKPLMEAYTGLYAKMTGLEAESFGKICAGLKPNQQKNAGQAFDLMSGMFMPVGGGGGGRGGGGRGMGRKGGN